MWPVKLIRNHQYSVTARNKLLRYLFKNMHLKIYHKNVIYINIHIIDQKYPSVYCFRNTKRYITLSLRVYYMILHPYANGHRHDRRRYVTMWWGINTKLSWYQCGGLSDIDMTNCGRCANFVGYFQMHILKEISFRFRFHRTLFLSVHLTKS